MALCILRHSPPAQSRCCGAFVDALIWRSEGVNLQHYIQLGTNCFWYLQMTEIKTIGRFHQLKPALLSAVLGWALSWSPIPLGQWISQLQIHSRRKRTVSNQLYVIHFWSSPVHLVFRKPRNKRWTISSSIYHRAYPACFELPIPLDRRSKGAGRSHIRRWLNMNLRLGISSPIRCSSSNSPNNNIPLI